MPAINIFRLILSPIDAVQKPPVSLPFLVGGIAIIAAGPHTTAGTVACLYSTRIPRAESAPLPSDRYLDGMSVLWLATQSHASLRLIQVSVKRERITYGLPLFVPVSR